MKRISILAWVLFLTAYANAAVNIAVNGNMNPPEIILYPSDESIISIWTDTVLTGPSYFGLGIQEGEPGSLFYDYISPLAHILIYPGPEPAPPPGFSSWLWLQFDGMTTIPPGTILADLIIFHCEGPGSVDLRLYESPDMTELLLSDIQRINQIPEPGTFALLGLGAMLLKRRW